MFLCGCTPRRSSNVKLPPSNRLDGLGFSSLLGVAPSCIRHHRQSKVTPFCQHNPDASLHYSLQCSGNKISGLPNPCQLSACLQSRSMSFAVGVCLLQSLGNPHTKAPYHPHEEIVLVWDSPQALPAVPRAEIWLTNVDKSTIFHFRPSTLNGSLHFLFRYLCMIPIYTK